MTKVTIVNTGCANLASVIAAFERLGASVVVTSDAKQIAAAERLVLPGVGTFGAAMDFWRRNELCDPILTCVSNNKHVLAICLGLQLLCESSEEDRCIAGMGVINEHILRFANDLSVPQMGWNFVAADEGSKWLQSGYYYFANSYCLSAAPKDSVAAIASYGTNFVAAFEIGNLLACQFHPELSGQLGASLLQNWLRGGQC